MNKLHSCLKYGHPCMEQSVTHDLNPSMSCQTAQLITFPNNRTHVTNRQKFGRNQSEVHAISVHPSQLIRFSIVRLGHVGHRISAIDEIESSISNIVIRDQLGHSIANQSEIISIMGWDLFHLDRC